MKDSIFRKYPMILGLIVAISGCDSSIEKSCPLPSGEIENQIVSISAVVNPHGIAPLTAIVELSTTNASAVELTVKGKNGMKTDIVRRFAQCENQHSLAVLGLYANYRNEVEVKILNNERVMSSEVLTIDTGLLPNDLPSFEIVKEYASDEPAFFLVNIINVDAVDATPPLIVDSYGEIRWYLEVPGTKTGLQKLHNGNIAFGLSGADRIEEYSMLGEAIAAWTVLPEFEDIHHDVYEMENGNFLVLVSKPGIETVEDFIVELDRQTGEIITTWDMREILPRRFTFIHDERDWLHVNAVIEDTRDNSIIVSGQRQGLFKVTRTNELAWILAPPDGWDGFEEYLLTLDGSGEFEWVWGQHAPLLLPDGDVLVVDNGFGREYGSGAIYTRAVQYHINENADKGGTVLQTWQYGKERGEELHSPIVSDVDFLSESDSVLITSGALAFDVSYVSADSYSVQWIEQLEKARIVEVDFDHNVIYEMLVMSPTTRLLIYRSEKISLF